MIAGHRLAGKRLRHQIRRLGTARAPRVPRFRRRPVTEGRSAAARGAARQAILPRPAGPADSSNSEQEVTA
ncbi:hypothetical protein UA75_06935 [Actinoalloteichus sp. GBA129-24]|uniref:Uncharacterized protein n=1 Tax=Actinoalloteichus fjordicus TaxID=1612552 RepID=A0AAC9LB61_9PSEU|nr:hypothetical protein UA74_06940 [Actinoalloteichus fjordicus]APU19406.1 hypothetical protein UA75_06935 [Actinoalloteichus sp. GBA129-24]